MSERRDYESQTDSSSAAHYSLHLLSLFSNIPMTTTTNVVDANLIALQLMQLMQQQQRTTLD